MKAPKFVLAALLMSWVIAAAAQAAVINFSEVALGTSNPSIGAASFWAGNPGDFRDTFTDDSWTPGNAYLASGRDDHTGKSPGLFGAFIGVSLPTDTYSVSFDILSEEVLPEGTTLWLQALSGGVLKGSTSLLVSDSAYYQMALNVGSDIDTVYIFDDLNSFGLSEAFHIDNFASQTGGVPAVPEPSTLLLMVSALAGTLIWRRRQSQ